MEETELNKLSPTDLANYLANSPKEIDKSILGRFDKDGREAFLRALLNNFYMSAPGGAMRLPEYAGGLENEPEQVQYFKDFDEAILENGSDPKEIQELNTKIIQLDKRIAGTKKRKDKEKIYEEKQDLILKIGESLLMVYKKLRQKYSDQELKG